MDSALRETLGVFQEEEAGYRKAPTFHCTADSSDCFFPADTRDFDNPEIFNDINR
jgi:hypothetical protein